MTETNPAKRPFESALTGRQISYFRAMMKMIGCDQKQIASAAGVSLSMLWRWEMAPEYYKATEEACLGITASAASHNFTILEHDRIPSVAAKV